MTRMRITNVFYESTRVRTELRVLQILKKIRGFVQSTRATNRRISTLLEVVRIDTTQSLFPQQYFNDQWLAKT